MDQGIPSESAAAAGTQAPASRCRACQLQLCKSRREPPHADLKETSRDERGRWVQYECGACGTALRRSEDMTAAGWSIARAAP